MKKSKIGKWIALLAAGSLLTGTMTGCGSAEENKESTGASSTSATESAVEESTESAASSEVIEPEGIIYPVEGAGTLTWASLRKSQWSERYESFADLPIGQELQERTGFTLEMEHVDNVTAMNLLLASGDFPDMILYNINSNYSGKEPKAIQDGIIYGMTEEFVQENAPDYWDYLLEKPEVKKSVTTPDGLISSFAFVRGDDLLRTSQSLIIRDDWCDQLGMELPETVEEYYEMLKGFKEKLRKPER